MFLTTIGGCTFYLGCCPRWQTGIFTSSCQVIGNLVWRWVNRLGTVVCTILGGRGLVLGSPRLGEQPTREREKVIRHATNHL